MHGLRLRCAGVALAGIVTLRAHPMGNFSVNHYTRIEPGRSRVEITYILDLGETPAYAALKEARTPEQWAREWIQGLEFSSGDRRLTPQLQNAGMTTSKGEGGLKTARFTMRMRIEGAKGELQFEDRNFKDRPGWKEIVIRGGAGVSILRASQPAADRSTELTNFPGATPNDLRARVEWKPGTGAAGAIMPIEQPAPVETKTESVPAPQAEPANKDYLAALLGRKEIGPGLIIAGMAVALGLGAMHALSPGHGKTIVAAYLVGSRGTMRHAAFLGAMVTFTHTASVFALGLAALFLSEYVATERIARSLGVVSGLSIVAVGALLFSQRWRRLRHAWQHAHGHAHQHHEGEHHHHHHHGHAHTHVPEGEVSIASLIALGASGGLAPCPSALVLLLSSIALGRVGLGLTLLIAFSAGLAGVLMAIGMMVLYAKQWLPDPSAASRHGVFHWVPVISAGVIVCVGVVMTGVSLGWISAGGL